MDTQPSGKPAAGPPAAPGRLPPGTVFAERFEVNAFVRLEGPTEVYRGVDQPTGAPVTIRIGRDDRLGPSVTKLESDADAARAILHKNVIGVLGAGHQAGAVFVVTEGVEGQTLRQMLDTRRAEGRGLGLKAAYNVIAHVANALAEVHRLGAHGCVNPGAVWLDKAGRVRLDHVGLGRAVPALARLGAPAGCPESVYLAPEVATGQPATVASDVYALGAMLYEALGGKPPVPPLRPPSATDPEVSPAVDQVLAQALSRDPARRPESPTVFKEALVAAMEAPRPAAPAPPAPAGSPRKSMGRSFDPAQMAAGVTGEDQERWLIQKDRLDYGPFSMAQVKAQIERGDFRGDDLIIEMDTGARRKVKDHPLLSEFTRQAERRLEQTRRAQDEQASEKVERKKSLATVLIAGGALAALGLGLGIYLVTRQAAATAEHKQRAGEADVEEFLKNVKVEFAAVRVARAVRGGGHRPGAPGGGNDPFSMDQNMGDVSQGGGGDETLDENVIQQVMVKNFRSLIPCVSEERRRNPGLSNVALDLVITGSGKVSAVKVNGQRSGGLPACVLGRMRAWSFPRFNGSKTVASWSFRMG